MLNEIAEQSSTILIDSINSGIQASMKSGHTADVQNMLSKIIDHDFIKVVRIVNSDGKIKHSSNTSEAGQSISARELTALNKSTQDKFFSSDTKSNDFDSFSKILNSEECHSCHSASQPYIAFIEIELSLKKFTQYIKKEQINSVV